MGKNWLRKNNKITVMLFKKNAQTFFSGIRNILQSILAKMKRNEFLKFGGKKKIKFNQNDKTE